MNRFCDVSNILNCRILKGFYILFYAPAHKNNIVQGQSHKFIIMKQHAWLKHLVFSCKWIETVEQDVVAFDIVFVVDDNNYLFSTVMLKGLQFNLIVYNNFNWDELLPYHFLFITIIK